MRTCCVLIGMGTCLAIAIPANAGCNSGSVAITKLLTDGGCQASAAGDRSTAVGLDARANAADSLAIGESAYAFATYSSSIGTLSGPIVPRQGSTALGRGAGRNGSGQWSIVIGAGELITGNQSAPVSPGDYSIALGSGNGITITPPGGQSFTLTGARSTGGASSAIGTGSQATGMVLTRPRALTRKPGEYRPNPVSDQHCG